VAHHELYCGLIELGVGLIPAGGGTKELLQRALNRVAWDEQADPLPYLKSAFKTIGLGKVSMSAWEAKQLGYLRDSDVILMNRFHLLRQAKTEAKALADQGYRPPQEPSMRLLGATGYSALNVMLYIMEEGGFVAPYDRILAQKVAKVMTGGELSELQDVPESLVLQMERDAILECMWDERTNKKNGEGFRCGLMRKHSGFAGPPGFEFPMGGKRNTMIRDELKRHDTKRHESKTITGTEQKSDA